MRNPKLNNYLIFDFGRGLNSVENAFNNIKRLTRTNFPYVYKMITSPHTDYRFAKSVLCFFIGTIYALILWYLTISQLDQLNKNQKMLIAAVYLLFISVGMTFFVQMRCIMTLSIAKFISDAGRSILVVYLLINIFCSGGPADIMIKNTQELSRSILCYQALIVNHTKDSFRVKWKPYKDIIVGILKGDNDMLQSGKEMSKLITNLDKELIGESLVQETTKFNKIKSLVTTKQTTLNYQQMEERYKKSVIERCKLTAGKTSDNCKQIFENYKDKCRTTLTKFLGWICGLIDYVRDVSCSKLDGKMGDNCNRVSKNVKINQGLGESVGVLDKLRQLFLDVDLNKGTLGFNSIDEFKSNYTDEKMKLFADLRVAAKEREAEFNFIYKYLQLIVEVGKGLANFGFIIVFINAFNYHRKYLHDISYDNFYLSQYFRHIDARRYNEGKRTLLPMKKLEQLNLVYPFQFKIPTKDKSGVKRNLVLFVLLVIIVAIFILINWPITTFMHMIRKYGRVRIIQRGHHKIKFHITGNGWLAKLLKKVFKDIDLNEKVDTEKDSVECFPNIIEITTLTMIEFGAVLVLIFISIYAEVYVRRLNRAICAFYYRKWEKQRILWLYNSSLKKRKIYIESLVKKAVLRSRGFEIEPDLSLWVIISEFLRKHKSFKPIVHFLKAINVGLLRCIVCDQLERVDNKTCKSCGSSFCYECWIDVSEICLVCTPLMFEEIEWRFEGNALKED